MVNIGGLARFNHLTFRSIGFRIKQVVHDCCVEQHGVLRYNTYFLAQAGKLYVFNIITVHIDGSFSNVVEAVQ